jgi:sugar transferase (PEP-CTERM/EpsH1 system associated)
MAKVLYLTHRMPFPPDKGDKITTYNFLRHLASKHEVVLGAFVDSEADWSHVDELKRFCVETRLIALHPLRQRLWSARALLQGLSISEVYHRERTLQAWVDEAVPRHGIRTALAYCSAMAPYVAGPRFAGLRRVTHYADVDSEKWQTYAQTQRGPMAWVYAREARTLLQMERRMSAQYDITSFVSDADARLYQRLAPEVAERVRVVPNGVDTDYFTPDADHDNPYPAGSAAIVFTGAMDYWPNADAVSWFAQDVLPLVRQRQPQAELWIVGSNPGAELRKLAERAGVKVTGRVPDVRPYIAHAAAVVAPLRVARGTQNKVLEAFAMARPVVMSSAAANGLQAMPFIAEHTDDEPAAMAAAVVQAMGRPPRFEAARAYVMERYSWAHAFGLLDEALQI